MMTPVFSDTQDTDPNHAKHSHTRYDVHVGGKNVGYITVGEGSKVLADELGIKGFYVAPEYRGQGLATKLMQMVIDKNPGQRLSLTADPYDYNSQTAKPPKSIEELVEMYKHYGFVQHPSVKGRMLRLPINS